ncbi:MAG: 3-hydroxyacyl-CoA dehydrogenase/enoyl-CoA hydratase family protein [SAR202 cluster bacterium]|jgi:3-hydroxyacyl-CoA dehydrogenase|nr:3-hydroxyacyl-CoA dehydrogenase/enoyl-CoA hydratase family protein [SAR202 cluster bacterium]|tara:strand:+ start:978 stop:3398 length:2421 start_codon:yes stop_codon:yes gene_type:complete
MNESEARRRIKCAAVLGSGVMGAQIAALFANQGIPCFLFDLKGSQGGDDLSVQGLKKLAQLDPSPVYGEAMFSLLTPLNYEDHSVKLRESDWIIEAISENLEIKKQVWTSISEHIRDDAIISTNTSGLSVASIAQSLPERLKGRFLGTHFFNPPRYLKLLELIPIDETTSEVIDSIKGFSELILGKGIVISKDVPNFVGNRIGCYGVLSTMRSMAEFGLDVAAVDAITGTPMGRPRSATFRTLDMVGLDVFLDVCRNVTENISDSEERTAFEPPSFITEMVNRGWLGQKSGQGFYKRIISESGDSEILMLDIEEMNYIPRRRYSSTVLSSIQNEEDALKRISTFISSDDPASQFARKTLLDTLNYASTKIGELTDNTINIDNAIKWGFGWDIGPFEIWDHLGLKETASAIRSEGFKLAPLIIEHIARGKNFYSESHGKFTVLSQSGYEEIQAEESTQLLEAVRQNILPVVFRNGGASIIDLGDGVAMLDFHSPRQAIGPDMLSATWKAAELVPKDFRGLVLSSHVETQFCVGANLMLVGLAAQDGDWEEIDQIIRNFQNGLLALKRMPIPQVSAPFGFTLGGGAELFLSADRTVAAAETYMGLVEVGAGLIPAGGGCKELLIRYLGGLPGGLERFAPRRRGGPSDVGVEVNPEALVAEVFLLIGLAQTSRSAVEGRRLGFLRESDQIVPNRSHLLARAKEAVITIDAAGYSPPPPAQIPVLGPGTRSLLELAVQTMRWGEFASEHDQKIAGKLANVLTGGSARPGTTASEEHFLDLEREAFASLCGEPKTLERMQALLTTGRPLRN